MEQQMNGNNNPNYQGRPMGFAPQWGVPQPPPKKKGGKGKKILLGIGAFIAVCVIAGVSSGGGDDNSKSGNSISAPVTATEESTSNDNVEPLAEETPEEKPTKKAVKKTSTQLFKEFINKHGTATQKAAAKHITNVEGAGDFNDFFDTAEIYTDYSGNLFSADAGKGKLLASAFASWKDSKNGLVTVYNEGGEVLSNGNF